MNQSYVAMPRRAQMPKATSQEPLAVDLPDNIHFRSNDDREAFVQLFQQHVSIFRPNGELERSYVGYLAMALFRFDQLIAIENTFLQLFPQGSKIDFQNLSEKGRELLHMKNDRDVQKFWKALKRDQRDQQASRAHWERTLRFVQRHFPVTRP